MSIKAVSSHELEERRRACQKSNVLQDKACSQEIAKGKVFKIGVSLESENEAARA